MTARHRSADENTAKEYSIRPTRVLHRLLPQQHRQTPTHRTTASVGTANPPALLRRNMPTALRRTLRHQRVTHHTLRHRLLTRRPQPQATLQRRLPPSPLLQPTRRGHPHPHTQQSPTAIQQRLLPTLSHRRPTQPLPHPSTPRPLRPPLAHRQQPFRRPHHRHSRQQQ